MRFVLAVDPATLALRATVERHGGVVLRESGPLLAGFHEVVDAMAAGRALQREASARLGLAADVNEAAALLRTVDENHLAVTFDVATALGAALPSGARSRGDAVIIEPPPRTTRALRAVIPAPLALIGPFVGR